MISICECHIRQWQGWRRLREFPSVPTIIDIGVGPRGTPYLYRHFPQARFVLVDPLEECQQGVARELSDPRNVFLVTALGAHNTVADIHVQEHLSYSSLLLRTGQGYVGNLVEKRQVRVRTLDCALKGLRPEKPYGIKVDTEGYELEVLKGASDTLQDTLFVIVEVNFAGHYEGSYAFEDLVQLMSNNGFTVYAILTSGPRHCDVVFKKRSDDKRLS